MSNRAWMPLHIADYLADTGHLTATEHGAYLLLIMHYWQNGSLPENQRMLARIGKLSKLQWDESGFIIMDLFSRVRDGFSAAQRAWGEAPKRIVRPPIPVDVRRAVFLRDGHRCRYCGSFDGPFHLDHMMPWSRGGRHTVENLTVACESCNCSKGALTAEEFAGALQ
jgi:hypothetical protein